MQHYNDLMDRYFGPGNGPKIDVMYTKEQTRQKSPQIWECEDGWVVGYNPHKTPEGTWEIALYKPLKGAPHRLTRVYLREFKTRKAAKARATALYRKHSPKWDARHPA